MTADPSFEWRSWGVPETIEALDAGPALPTRIGPSGVTSSLTPVLFGTDYDTGTETTDPHLEYLTDFDSTSEGDYLPSHARFQAPGDGSVGFLRAAFPATALPAYEEIDAVRGWVGCSFSQDGPGPGPDPLYGHLLIGGAGGTAFDLEILNPVDGSTGMTFGGVYLPDPGEWPLYDFEIPRESFTGTAFDDFLAELEAGTAWAEVTYQCDPPSSHGIPSNAWLEELNLVMLTGGAPDPDPAPGWIVDEPRTDGLVSYQITHGRTDANSQPQPMTATVVLAAELAAPCPESDARVRLAVTDGETTWERFTGEVTDPTIDPVRRLYTVTGVGRLGRARRTVVDGRGWPVELDGDRIRHILKAAAPDLERDVDDGTAGIIRVTDRASFAGVLIDEVAASTLGSLVELHDGKVQWHDADHRRGSTEVLELDDSEIMNNLVWSQHVGDVVNDAQVGYGRQSGSIRIADPDSIDTRGSFPAYFDTALADKSDAHSLGSKVVGRRSAPVWQLPQLYVDLTRHNDTDGVDAAKRAELLELRHGHRILVTGIPAGSPYSASVSLFVEGITETAYRINGGLVWQLALAVSDPRLSGVSIRWKDVPDGFTWSDVTAGLRWLDVAQIEDPAELGA